MTKPEDDEDGLSEKRNHIKLDAQMEIIENQGDLSEGMLGESESSDSNNHIYVQPNQLDWKTGVARLINTDENQQQISSPEMLDNVDGDDAESAYDEDGVKI